MSHATQHEKTLAIAKAMYGEECVKTFPQNGICIRNNEMKPFKEFNPYTSAEDSQAVQEFIKLSTNIVSNGNWESATCDRSIANDNKDLKTAIADCAYEVAKEM